VIRVADDYLTNIASPPHCTTPAFYNAKSFPMSFNIFRKSKLRRRKFEGAQDNEVGQASRESRLEGMNNASPATTSSSISSKKEEDVSPVTVVPATWPDMAEHAKDATLRAQLIAWFQDPSAEKLNWHVSLGGLMLHTAIREYLLCHLEDQNSLHALPVGLLIQ
jgi:hypothetical protein